MEEVIRQAIKTIDIIHCKNCDGEDCVYCIYLLAKGALSRQIPQAPYVVSPNEWKCPECYSKLNLEIGATLKGNVSLQCRHCGQALAI